MARDLLAIACEGVLYPGELASNGNELAMDAPLAAGATLWLLEVAPHFHVILYPMRPGRLPFFRGWLPPALLRWFRHEESTDPERDVHDTMRLLDWSDRLPPSVTLIHDPRSIGFDPAERPTLTQLRARSERVTEIFTRRRRRIA